MSNPRPVILFGYDSSPFTNKVRLALRLKQIPYTYIPVPSMMPRPVLRDTFNTTYRKIPILAIGRDVYCDTSIILEALEHWFPGTRSLYPDAVGHEGARLFGTDRAGLIGHALDADKLERKRSENLLALDTQLSLLAPLFKHSPEDIAQTRWIFSTPYPSLTDLSLYYQLNWLRDISRGVGIENLTGGGTSDTNTEGSDTVFNANRYPEIWNWFCKFRAWIEAQPPVETRSSQDSPLWKAALESCEWSEDNEHAGQTLIATTGQHGLKELESRCGLHVGAEVGVAPDDTGRDE